MTLSCSDKDCEDIDCFSPPYMFVFDIVDKDTGENVFTSETYTPDQISVLNSEDGSAREYDFIDENNVNLIRIGSIGWTTEIAQVDLIIADKTILKLYVDAERVTEDCCNFSVYNEFSIDDAEYEQNQQTGVYTVYVTNLNQPE